MATLKIISDSDCHVFIDLEPRCDIKANTLCKLSLNKGTYIIDCVHVNQIDKVSWDYNIHEENTEYLLRVSLNDIYQARIKEYETLSDEPFVVENLKCAKKITTQSYGVIDDQYNEIIPFQYNGVRFCKNYVCVSINDKCGVIDLHNNIVIPIQCEEIDIRYDDIGLFMFKKETGWGAKSINGYEIPCIYCELIECDRENRIYAKNKDGQCGVIDFNNNIIIPFAYSEIEFDHSLRPHDFYIVKSAEGLMGVIDKKTGNPIIPCRYSYLQVADDKYKVCCNDEWGTLTRQGERIIRIGRYDDKGARFEENYMIPSKYDWCDRDYIDEKGDYTIVVEANGKYGLMNIVNKTEIVPCIYDYLGSETEDGIIPCALHGRWGGITKTGQFITKLQYNVSRQIDNNRMLIMIWGPRHGDAYIAILDEDGHEISPLQYYEKILYYKETPWIWVKRQGKFGGIDTNGKVIIPFQYEDVGPIFSEGLLEVKKQGKWGYINTFGEIILPCQYDHAAPFSKNGIAEVTIDRKQCRIDNCGHFVVHRNKRDVWLKGDFDIACDFHDNLALVRKNGLWGFIDEQENVIIPFIYEDASVYEEGLSACKKNGLYGFIDKSGNTIIPFKFEWASSFCNGYAKISKEVTWNSGIPIFLSIITSQNINNKEEFLDDTRTFFGFINKQGQTIIKPTYGSISNFSKNGIATVYSDEDGYIDPFVDRYPYYINTANEKITISQ